MKRVIVSYLLLTAAVALAPKAAVAQGVTTSSIVGTITGGAGTKVAGAQIRAVHMPSGTAYTGTARADGRFTIPGMRVGGPYTVTVRAIGFEPQVKQQVFLDLGIATDVAFDLKAAVVQLNEIVVTEAGELSSTRTGASTRVTSEALGRLPTINRLITDITKLTPQASGTSFAGQDNRFNNLTVDGSYFNNSFGLGGQPGARTNVSPIPLDAIEQVQVNVAPYDVRQGNFVGAGINAVTKSGTNEFKGSLYRIQRSQGLVGTQAGANVFNPGVFDYGLWGGFVSGPVIKDKLFFFFSAEDDQNAQPGTNAVCNPGGATVAGNQTRVLCSDLQNLSSYLQTNFNYTTGAYQGYNFTIPSRRYTGKVDFNINDRNKLSIRYTQLNSSSDQIISGSGSLGNTAGRRGTFTDFLSFQASNYAILENIRSIIGELSSQVGDHSSNDFIFGYSESDESRDWATRTNFPFVDVLNAAGGTTYTSFGFEPFTPLNTLTYKTWQLQDNFTIYGDKHDLTFGITGQKYNSTNIFAPGLQGAWVYNSLQDFYNDANFFKNGGAAPLTSATRFQYTFNNIPGNTQPVQPLEVYYAGAYAQDEFRPTKGLKLTIGVRADVPFFSATGYTNASANALTYRDGSGNPVQLQTQQLPNSSILWSPRFGFNWDLTGDRSTQIRGGTGIFTGPPPYVWISNQIGNNGVLTGNILCTANCSAYRFTTNPSVYAPATVTGAPASGSVLNFTDPNYKFQQTWRSNLAIDQKLPFGFTGTIEGIYSKDVNGYAYYNGVLPAAQTAYTGPDTRPRWTANTLFPAGPGLFAVPAAYVLTNQNQSYSWNVAASVEKAFSNGWFLKAAYSYGQAKNTIDPGSIAAGSFTGNAISGDPNAPPVANSSFYPGQRGFLAVSYRKQYFNFGATTISLFLDGFTQGVASYVFAGDANGDGASNDLIYVPKDQTEMRFQQYTATVNGVVQTFTPAAQAAAWDAYISQDPYLSTRRGQYAERNGFVLPMLWRGDVSINQELFGNIGRSKNTLSVRLDILNFTNLINSSWGVSDRLVSNQPLTNASVDANGNLQYRLRNIGGVLLGAPGNAASLQSNANIGDVWRMQLGFRYTFN